MGSQFESGQLSVFQTKGDIAHLGRRDSLKSTILMASFVSDFTC